MTWKHLLEDKNATIVAPWLGDDHIFADSRTFNVYSRTVLKDHGWYTFSIKGNTAFDPIAVTPQYNLLKHTITGYLVGDRIVADNANVNNDPFTFPDWSERVFLLEDNLDRFARITAGRIWENGSLIFKQQEMPLGVETVLLNRYLDHIEDISDVKGIHPALEAAFRLECYHRTETAKRREELLRLQREEEERRLQEERRSQLATQLSGGAGRRRMVPIDFEQAARAALSVGGAEYLEHQVSNRNGEMLVRFRLQGRRFECICDQNLRIVDAGICLKGHDRDAVLETLPVIIAEGIRTSRLVIYRHVDDSGYTDEDDDF